MHLIGVIAWWECPESPGSLSICHSDTNGMDAEIRVSTES